MPNFALSAQLRQNFAPASKYNLRTEGRLITEALNKYGTQSTRAFSELKSISPAFNRLVINPNVELALLFIDITGFSVKTADMSPPMITRILDEYYAELLPMIYEHSGEVEKIMGDGIVAVFGAPFTQGSYNHQWIQAAEKCAEQIARARHSHTYSVKIAIHYGKLMYYHNNKTTIDEFYAIGKPMTELFRLESQGIDKHLTYYVNSGYDAHRKIGLSALTTWWKEQPARRVELKGVGFNQVIDLR